MVSYNKDATPTPCEPGVTRRILSYNDDVMVCEISFEQGSRGNLHSHPHTQISYVGEGKFEYTINNEPHIIEKGDSILVPSNAQHGTLCLEKGILVDVFTPKREDFLK